MTAVLVLGLLVGLDNLQVGAGLGLVRMSAARRWAFAIAFALCETVMPLAGLALGHAVADLAGSWAEEMGIAVLALCGLLIIVLSLRGKEAEESWAGNLALAGLPLSLSLDNLAAGVGLGSLGFPLVASALIIGVVSGSLCALGLFAGTRIRRWVPERSELWSGIYLVVLAVGRLLESA
jgi:putative Mn2+ efflux pump MntP